MMMRPHRVVLAGWLGGNDLAPRLQGDKQTDHMTAAVSSWPSLLICRSCSLELSNCRCAAAGLCRFEDLPVAQLHTKHADPQVAAGLAAIAKLDGELREASLKVGRNKGTGMSFQQQPVFVLFSGPAVAAVFRFHGGPSILTARSTVLHAFHWHVKVLARLPTCTPQLHMLQCGAALLQALVTARALNPEQWVDTEKRRLERRAAELDAALAKERQRRAHAAKLRGALSKLDEDYSSASLLCLATGG